MPVTASDVQGWSADAGGAQKFVYRVNLSRSHELIETTCGQDIIVSIPLFSSSQ